MSHETAFTMDTSSIKFGPGVTREVGQDMADLGARRVMVVTDPNLAASEPVTTVTEQKIWSRADVAEVIRAESVSRINFPGAPPLDESVQELISIGQ